jgi:hypothetical protein
VIGIILAFGFESKNFKKNFSNSKIEYCTPIMTGAQITERVDFLLRKKNIQCIVIMVFAFRFNDSLQVGDFFESKTARALNFCRILR